LRQYIKETFLYETQNLVVCYVSFRLLSPEFLPTLKGKYFCEGLLTKKFTVLQPSGIWPVKGKICFLVFLPVPTLFQCLSQSAVILSLLKIISYKYILSTMAPRRQLPDEDIESKMICHTDSDEYVADTKSEEDCTDEQQ
jgi:hypothetical protein